MISMNMESFLKTSLLDVGMLAAMGRWGQKRPRYCQAGRTSDGHVSCVFNPSVIHCLVQKILLDLALWKYTYFLLLFSLGWGREGGSGTDNKRALFLSSSLIKTLIK